MEAQTFGLRNNLSIAVDCVQYYTENCIWREEGGPRHSKKALRTYEAAPCVAVAVFCAQSSGYGTLSDFWCHRRNIASIDAATSYIMVATPVHGSGIREASLIL